MPLGVIGDDGGGPRLVIWTHTHHHHRACVGVASLGHGHGHGRDRAHEGRPHRGHLGDGGDGGFHDVPYRRRTLDRTPGHIRGRTHDHTLPHNLGHHSLVRDLDRGIHGLGHGRCHDHRQTPCFVASLFPRSPHVSHVSSTSEPRGETMCMVAY